MSQREMEALIDIVDWYASPLSIFTQMYRVEKPPHVLPKFSMDKLVMQEVSYDISKGLSSRLHIIRRHLGPLFFCELGYTIYIISSMLMLR